MRQTINTYDESSGSNRRVYTSKLDLSDEALPICRVATVEIRSSPEKVAQIWENARSRQDWDKRVTVSDTAMVDSLGLSLDYIKTDRGWITPSRDYISVCSRLSPAALGLTAVGPILLFTQDARSAITGLGPEAIITGKSSTGNSISRNSSRISGHDIVAQGLGRWLPFWTVRAVYERQDFRGP